MSVVKTGICPSCGKDRQLAYFQFGVIKCTLCPHCLKRYLDMAVLPRLVDNSDYDNDKVLITGGSKNE